MSGRELQENPLSHAWERVGVRAELILFATLTPLRDPLPQAGEGTL
jgi:hypothetical protein